MNYNKLLQNTVRNEIIGQNMFVYQASLNPLNINTNQDARLAPSSIWAEPDFMMKGILGLGHMTEASDVLTASGRGMVISIPTNPAGDAINDMNSAKNELIKLFNNNVSDSEKISSQDFDSLVDKFGIDFILGNLPTDNLAYAKNLARMYKTSQDNLNSFMEGMNENDRKESLETIEYDIEAVALGVSF